MTAFLSIGLPLEGMSPMNGNDWLFGVGTFVYLRRHSIIKEQMESSYERFRNLRKKLFYTRPIVELLADTMQATQPLGKYGTMAYGGLRL